MLPDGYMGWVEEDHRYRIFATEKEYEEVVHGTGTDCDENESR